MKRGTLASMVAAGLMGVVSLPVLAQKPGTTPSGLQIPPMEGAAVFESYCAVCHGQQGKGDGPAAVVLKTPVPDLTTYARRHGGKFSAATVQEIISGEKRVMAHGSPDMPIWGPLFRELSPDEGTHVRRLANLVKHIESLQK